MIHYNNTGVFVSVDGRGGDISIGLHKTRNDQVSARPPLRTCNAYAYMRVVSSAAQRLCVPIYIHVRSRARGRKRAQIVGFSVRVFDAHSRYDYYILLLLLHPVYIIIRERARRGREGAILDLNRLRSGLLRIHKVFLARRPSSAPRRSSKTGGGARVYDLT